MSSLGFQKRRLASNIDARVYWSIVDYDGNIIHAKIDNEGRARHLYKILNNVKLLRIEVIEQ